MNTGSAIFAILAVCLLLTACGDTTRIDYESGGLRISAALDQQSSIGAESAELELLPVASSSGMTEYRLRAANLSGAQALYGTISYDPRALQFAAGDAAAFVDDGVRLFVAEPEASTIHFGWVLASAAGKQSIDGSIELGTLRFGAGFADRVVSVPPTGEGGNNQFTLSGLVQETGEPVLSWFDTNDGDGDNNGLVTISDLTPIGQQIGRSVPAETTDPNWGVIFRADYDGNGLVTIADLTPVGQNFNKQLSGYVVQSGPSEINLTDLTTLERVEEFGAVGTGDGQLTWSFTGAVLTETTFFRVVPIDSSGNRGRPSDNVVQLEPNAPPIEEITDITDITFTGSESWPTDANGNFIVLLSELSVDGIAGNSESFAPELLDLAATVEFNDDPGNTGDGTEDLIWFLSEGAGLATINNTAGSKGELEFINRGQIEITAQVIGDPLLTETIGFVLLSIDSLALELAAGGTGPANVASGTDVAFEVTGTFDWDGLDNGNEVTQDLTDSCNWGLLPDAGNTGSFSIDTDNGVLNTDAADSGDSVQVTCEYPRTDDITLGDNTKRTSNFVTVNVT